MTPRQELPFFIGISIICVAAVFLLLRVAAKVGALG